MTLNPFEQLKSLQPGPEQCFEEIVSMILRHTVTDVRRVRVYGGDDGVDNFTGAWGDSGELDVYQVKYFASSSWGAAQRQQITRSYDRAARSSSYSLRKWILVVPSDLTAKEWKWFDEWREEKQGISVLDGSHLTDCVLRGQCAPARNKLREWGVVGLPNVVAIQAWVRLTQAVDFPLVLNVWLENIGDMTARSIRMDLDHIETNTRGGAVGDDWRQLPVGPMRLLPTHPLNLECTRVINPMEKVPIVPIPFREIPQEEIWLRIHLTSEDQLPFDAVCRFRPDEIRPEEVQRFYFVPEKR
jgi:hypothetical protein